MSKLAPLNVRLKQLAWFVGLWLAGVTCLAVVASIIRWVISTQFPQ